MAKCDRCGQKMGFFDVTYHHGTSSVCVECFMQIHDAKRSKAEPVDHPTERDEEYNNAKSARELTQTEIMHQLCNDVHKMAGDLRFIKNYILFIIILTVVSALVTCIALVSA